MLQSLTGNTHDTISARKVTEDTAKTRIESALHAHGSLCKSGKWQCPAHPDRKPSLSLSAARDYQGVILHCFTGCPQDAVLSALGLTPGDIYDEQWTASTPARDAITRLRAIPVQWDGRKGRNQAILYDACLTKAWDINSLTFEYSKRQAALSTCLSAWVAGNTFRELCALHLLTCHGITERGHGNTYEILTGTATGGSKLNQTQSTSTNTSLTGYFSVWLTIDPPDETKAWLRPTGLAVVRVMSGEAKPLAEITRESGVSRNTVRKILRTMLRSNGLAEETESGWKLTGNITTFHPGTDIMDVRAATVRKDRESYAAHLARQADYKYNRGNAA